MSNKFPSISTAKLEEGIFMGTQIQEILAGLIDLELTGLEQLKVGLFKLLRGKEIS